MALKEVKFQAGIDKQSTPSAAAGKWVDSNFVRFRYGVPEKIGGWDQLTTANNTLPGVARAQHTFTNLNGTKFSAIGTSSGLFIFSGERFYDVTPLAGSPVSGGTFTTSLAAGSTVTINSTGHSVIVGDYVVFTSVSVAGSTTLTAPDFQTYAFEVLTVPNANSFTISLLNPAAGVTTAEGNSGMTAQGSFNYQRYIRPGPTFQTLGFGWSTYQWGQEAWGDARSTSNVTLDPANWSLDHAGNTLIATLRNGNTFQWNSAGALATRATVIAGVGSEVNMVSTLSLFSDRDRHLFQFGALTDMTDATTQDPMFIRFTNQETLNVYTPTATNTAGTFRLDTGNKITAAVQGKDYVLILTDQAAYVAQFVGPPFTFSIRQVGTNCGCLGQHAVVFAQGAVYWMGQAGGFFAFDGTVKQIPCLVEDFVFTTGDGNPGLNFDANEIIYAGHNSLYTEVNWFYPTENSLQVDRCVTYNYAENSWHTSTLDRTTYSDADVFERPFATDYIPNGSTDSNSPSDTPLFPISGVTNRDGATVLYEHEKDVDQVNSTGTSAIQGFIRSGDFDIADGEFFASVSRFIPDYKEIVGNNQVTLFISDYPSDTQTSSPLGPFTVTSTTDKIDTRARGRLVSVKFENTAVGESWRYGSLRLDTRPDGRR